MLLEEFKKPKEQQEEQIVNRKKYFGEKENVELNRINQRSITAEPQQPVSRLIHQAKPECPSFLDKKERFMQPDVWVLEQLEREKQLNQKKDRVNQRTMQRMQYEADKWNVADKRFVDEQQRQEARMKSRKESNFHYAQGFNLINMQYEKNNKGETLQQHDNRTIERNTQRAKTLFEKNNGKFDIFTGQPKKLKTVDILDNFV